LATGLYSSVNLNKNAKAKNSYISLNRITTAPCASIALKPDSHKQGSFALEHQVCILI